MNFAQFFGIECREILKRNEEEEAKKGDAKTDSKEEAKRQYDEKLAELQQKLEEGLIDEIPADMKKFKYKKPKTKTWKSYKKVVYTHLQYLGVFY